MGIGRSGFRFALGTLCGFAWALASACSADAFVSYPDPTTLESGQLKFFGPEIIIAPDGSRLAVWESFDSTVHYAQSGPAGAFGTPESIPGQSVGFDVAFAPNGTATLAWTPFGIDGWSLETAQLELDGTFGPVHELAAPSQDSIPYASVVVDSQNRATVAWSRKQNGVLRARAARIAADGTPGAPQTLSDASRDAFGLELAIDASDRVTATWLSTGGFEDYRLGSRRIDESGSLEPRQFLTSTQDYFDDHDLVAADDGRVFVAWLQERNASNRIYARAITPGGDLRPIRAISDPDQVGQQLDLALDGSDGPRIVFGSAGNDNFRIRTTELSSDAKPLSIRTISPEGRDAGSPSLAFDSADRAHVIWDRYDGSVRRIQTTRLSAAGEPGTVTTLSPAGIRAEEGSAIAVGPGDRPTAIWGSDDPGVIQVSRATLTAPETTITSGPPDGSATNEQTPTFEFTSNADAATFDCSTDGGPFVSCISPTTLPALTEGAHSFAVRATDDDGTDASPAEVSFTYDPDADPLDTKVEGRKVKASEKQKQKGKRIELTLKAGAAEDVTATVTGSIDPKGKGHSIDLQKIKDKSVGGGELRKFVLSPRKNKDEKKLVKSLKRDGSAKAKLKVILVDPSLNETSKTVTVKVLR